MYCNYLFCYTTSHGNHKEELEIATSLRPVHLLDIGALFWTSFNDFRNGTFKQQRLRSRSRSSIQRLVKKMGITSVRTRLQWDGWLHLASKHNLFVRLTVTAFLDPQIFILPSAKNDETCLTSYSSLYLQAFSFTTALSSCEKCHAWQWRFWSTKRRPEWRFSMQPSAVPGTSCVAHAQGVWWKDFVTDYMRVAR